MSAPREYQGHRSWNAWNVSLYIANEYNLYTAGVEALSRSKTLGGAVRRFYQDTGIQPTDRTPDGGQYNRLAVKLALEGLEIPLGGRA